MTVPAVAAVVAMTTGAVRPAPIEPSIPHDFADPTVLPVDGTYYAYSTTSRYGARNFHVPVQSSRLLTGGWSHPHDAMPELPSWVDKTAAGEGSVWAPAVTPRSHDGYLLYFTARSASQHVQCIGVGQASTPEGPFHSIGSHPLVCQPGDADDIDPKPFTDTDGTHYLLYSASRDGKRHDLAPTAGYGRHSNDRPPAGGNPGGPGRRKPYRRGTSDRSPRRQVRAVLLGQWLQQRSVLHQLRDRGRAMR